MALNRVWQRTHPLRLSVLISVLLVLTGCSAFDLLNGLVPTGDYRQAQSIAYGDHPRQKLDLYLPVTTDASDLPLVVFFYGGRWERGDRADYRFVADSLTRQGYAAAIVDYRLYPEVRFPAFVEDGASALAWLQRHGADHLKGNDEANDEERAGDCVEKCVEESGRWPGGVFVMGHSAGAHIAALLALDPRYLQAAGSDRDRLAGMIGLAGPYDFLPLKADDLKEMFGPPETYPRSQPINFVSVQAPPLLLLHGEDDDTVVPRNTGNLAAQLKAEGATVETRFYPDKGHVGLLLSLVLPFQGESGPLEVISDFIDQHR